MFPSTLKKLQIHLRQQKCFLRNDLPTTRFKGRYKTIHQLTISKRPTQDCARSAGCALNEQQREIRWTKTKRILIFYGRNWGVVVSFSFYMLLYGISFSSLHKKTAKMSRSNQREEGKRFRNHNRLWLNDIFCQSGSVLIITPQWTASLVEVWEHVLVRPSQCL